MAKRHKGHPQETGREKTVGFIFVLLPWRQELFMHTRSVENWSHHSCYPGVDDHLQSLTSLHLRCYPHSSLAVVYPRAWKPPANAQETATSVAAPSPHHAHSVKQVAGEPDFAKACSGWAFWSTLLGVHGSFYGSEAYGGIYQGHWLFQMTPSLPEGRNRGEKQHRNREAASLPLQTSSVGAVRYSNPF